MKELLFLILRLRAFLLFIFLQIICLILVVRYNNTQREIFISSSNAVSGFFYKQQNNLSTFFDLRDENESIANLNATLLQQIYQGTAQSGKVVGELIDSQYVFRPARVINNSINSQRNTILMDLGSRQGVDKRMGVVTERGIVGIVQNVSPHYANAASILNVETKVSAKIKTNGVAGSLQWELGDHKTIKLKEIPKHYADFVVGDTILTSGYSIVFPPSHPVGTIASINELVGQNFYDIEVVLFEDLAKLDFVYIVEHRLKEEIKSLENYCFRE